MSLGNQMSLIFILYTRIIKRFLGAPYAKVFILRRLTIYHEMNSSISTRATNPRFTIARDSLGDLG